MTQMGQMNTASPDPRGIYWGTQNKSVSIRLISVICVLIGHLCSNRLFSNHLCTN